MKTQQERLAEHLEQHDGLYDETTVRQLTAAATTVDARLDELAAEQRQSYGDLNDMLSTAVAEKFATGQDSYSWVVDFDEDSVVFSLDGVKQQAPYTVDGDTVDFGDAVPVREQTTYVPVEAKSATPAAAAPARSFPTAKRSFTSLVEQAPAHTMPLQVRMDAGDDPNVAQFDGYAYTIDEGYDVTDWLGSYRESIGPGASSKTLREQASIPLLLNHEGLPLANTQSKTSQLADDGHGLRNLASLDRRSGLTNDVCIALQRGDINKMSFSFRAINDDWNAAYDDRYVRELQLYDTSIVTYPANPATSADIVESMRSALGREGRSLWLAEHELSVRSALPEIAQRGEHAELDSDAADMVEKALRALAHADEVVSRSHGPHGRARTFLVAEAMMEMRAGKVLSGGNQKLLDTALKALGSAEKHHAKAADALSTLAESAAPAEDGGTGGTSAGKASGDGKSNGTPPGNGNPISPSDGAGPRAAALPEAVLRARQQVEALKRTR